ncbi:HNH endonuclease [Ureaplasma parvum]|uniref:HNH endonuclease n=1 Tax=Ureaplasma parvum TaxID=134821 RepID=UPI0026E93D14|nr:HNH endonuclease [Ureaplasma parvum]
MIKVSELLKNKIHPLIHGALISRIIVSKNNNFFAAVSSYQKSEKIKHDNFNFETYIDNYVNTLNQITNSNLWISYNEYKENYSTCSFNFGGKEKAILIIENDINISKTSFFNKLYAKLFNDSDWLVDDNLNENKKNFIRGFCELRGSIDTQRPLIAMDYFYENTFELNKARLLNEYLSIPYYIININFRELQEQYIKSINKRNSQLRLQLNWYVKNIGLINDYKTKIVNDVYNPFEIRKINLVNYIDMFDKTPQGSDLFLNRLIHFSSNIFGKKLTDNDILKLRNELGFDVLDTTTTTFRRNRDIVELVRLYTPDECGACKSKYNIQDRTFIHRRTKRPYFEIHHNISLNNNIELDNENNLVKLCPICHTTLKRGVGIEKEQKELIEQILINYPNVNEFAKHFFDTYDHNTIIEKIYTNLK